MRIVYILIVLALLMSVNLAYAAVPQLISLQGRLTNPLTGNPYTGSLSVTFRIWDNLSAGNQIWSETQTVNLDTNGFFDVLLGSVTPLPSLPENSYLEFQVGAETLSPRQRIVSSAFALRASTAEIATDLNCVGCVSTGEIVDGAVTTLKIADSSVTGSKISDATITDSDIAQISGTKISPNFGSQNVLTSGGGGNSLFVNGTSLFPNPAATIMSYAGDFQGTPALLVRGSNDQNLDLSLMALGKSATFNNPGLAVTNAGNVCIGCREPSNKLTVAGTADFSKVGIGLSNPGDFPQKLVVVGDARILGGLQVDGTKNAIVKTNSGEYRLMYSQESPEVWFEDFGSGQLINGKSHIDLDSIFLQTVTISEEHPMKVFVQLNGDSNGVYVVKGKTGFDIIELNNGKSNVPFDYRVVAKRKGFENIRLEQSSKAAETSSEFQCTLHS